MTILVLFVIPGELCDHTLRKEEGHEVYEEATKNTTISLKR